jgi:hypothetical protein
MKIEVKVIKEHEDGSADAMINFDTEGMELLIQEGMLSILGQYIEQNKNAQEGKKLRDKIAKEAKKSKKQKAKDVDVAGWC